MWLPTGQKKCFLFATQKHVIKLIAWSVTKPLWPIRWQFSFFFFLKAGGWSQLCDDLAAALSFCSLWPHFSLQCLSSKHFFLFFLAAAISANNWAPYFFTFPKLPIIYIFWLEMFSVLMMVLIFRASVSREGMGAVHCAEIGLLYFSVSFCLFIYDFPLPHYISSVPFLSTPLTKVPLCDASLPSLDSLLFVEVERKEALKRAKAPEQAFFF